MAVAETTLVEGRTPQRPHADLGLRSFLGAAFVLLSLGAVFTGLPILWSEVLHIPQALGNEFLSGALLILATLGLATGLFLVGRSVEHTYAQPGMRAGVVFLSLFALFEIWILSWVGALFQPLEFLGLIFTLGIMGFFGFLVFRAFHKPGFCQWLVDLEDQGWFHATSYKGNQGVRVRRGTVIGLLVLGIFGIITLVSHRSLGSSRLGANDWYVWIPFLGDETFGYYLPLLFSIHYSLPIILALLLFWAAWRVTNWPTFADFLIATEAEMNKVSWTTRKRLVQDTIVVLVTVVLLTGYLFAVDFFWIRVLEGVRVLQLDIRAEQQKQQEKTQW